MNFKLKQVVPSPELQQQTHENHSDREFFKEEAVEEEEDNGTLCQGLNSSEKNQPSSSKSSDNNQQISNRSEWLLATPVPQNLGKRKRKPKLLNGVSPVTIRRRKKKPSHSQSAQAIPDSEGKCMNKREKVNGGTSTRVQIKSPALIRAEELRSSLDNEYPSFVKVMVRSHVGSCFWMGLPVPFCRLHLPKKDTITEIEDEKKQRFEVKYIAEKTGLSAGWRKFVTANKLVEGDVLTFQLTEPTTFKVFVTKASDINVVAGGIGLLNLETHTKQTDADGMESVRKENKKLPESVVPMMSLQKKKQQSSILEEQSGNNSEEIASEVMESTKCSDNAILFRNVKKFEDFRIIINGECIDLELPEHVRKKYYELCCSKNCFLHERFLPGLHSKLTAGMIFEVVDTSDAIKACKITTPRKEFEKWDKSLLSFELLGMKIGFLRDRVRWLKSLAFDAEEAMLTKRYLEVKSQQARIDDEVKDLETKILKLIESEKFDDDVDELKLKAESYELMFHQEVIAPW